MDWKVVVFILIVLGAGAALILWYKAAKADKAEAKKLEDARNRAEEKLVSGTPKAQVIKEVPPVPADAPKPEVIASAPAVPDEKPSEPVAEEPAAAEPVTAPEAGSEEAAAPEEVPAQAPSEPEVKVEEPAEPEETPAEVPAGPEVAEEPEAELEPEPEPEPEPEEPKDDEPEIFDELGSGNGLPKPDPFVDDVFRIQFKEPVPGNFLVPLLADLDEFRSVAVVRCFAFEANQNQWFAPDRIGVFSQLVIYLQSATSRGFMDELAFAKFYQIIQHIEMKFDVVTDAPDQQDAVIKARNLSRIGREFGAQISFLLRCPREISVHEYGDACTELGFKRRSNVNYEKVGELVLDSQGRRLGNRRGILTTRYVDGGNIVISLAAGLSHPERAPLREFMGAANALAAMLEAEVVNAAGLEIDNSLLMTVQGELGRFYKAMNEAGVEPGSPTAHRLLN